MKFSIALTTLVIGSALTAPVASAQTLVSFTDENPQFIAVGSFGGIVTVVNTSTSATMTSGGNSLTYTTSLPPIIPAGPNVTQVNPPTFSSQNLGAFTLVIAEGQSEYTIPAGEGAFALTISQTLPTVGSQPLFSTLFGSIVNIQAPASSLGLSFLNPNFSIGNVNYSLNNILTEQGGFENVFLISPGINILSVNVTANAVPEPSTMATAAMGGLSLLGFGLRRRRKLANAA